MKISITIWGNRISPVFDVASELLVADIENNVVKEKTYISFDPGIPLELIKTLKQAQISILICGAISTQPADLIIRNDIKLISFATGNALKLLDSFAKKGDIDQKFMMPGCTTTGGLHQP